MANDEKNEKEFKYGVSDLASELEIQEASVRVALRKHEVAKAGKVYGWNNRKDFDAVVAKLTADKPAKTEKKPAKKVERKAA